jgi:predicted aspartyl protease
MSQAVDRLAQLGDMLALRVAIGNPAIGSNVVRLLLDTGSAYTVFPPDLLADMGCDLNLPLRRVKVVTAGGIIQAPIVILPWMNCLGQRFEDVPVMAHTASFGTFTSGLLGMDILRRCGAVIYTRRATIQLDAEL